MCVFARVCVCLCVGFWESCSERTALTLAVIISPTDERELLCQHKCWSLITIEQRQWPGSLQVLIMPVHFQFVFCTKRFDTLSEVKTSNPRWQLHEIIILLYYGNELVSNGSRLIGERTISRMRTVAAFHIFLVSLWNSLVLKLQPSLPPWWSHNTYLRATPIFTCA